MTISSHPPGQRDFGVRGIGWRPTTTSSWMAAAFLIALVSAIAVLATFGAGERGTVIALRVTARWSFLLFWLAYTGSAMARLLDPALPD